jgi:glycosyltransferase
MNKGVRLARGEVVGFLNADDLYPSGDVLEVVVRALGASQAQACYGDLAYLAKRDSGRVIRFWRAGKFQRDAFYFGWMPPHPSFFALRSLYLRHGGFDTRLGSAADYELMLRFLLVYRAEAVYVPRTLVHMRAGGLSNASLKSRLRANRMDRKAWEVNGLKPYPFTLWLKPVRKTGQFLIRKNAFR